MRIRGTCRVRGRMASRGWGQWIAVRTSPRRTWAILGYGGTANPAVGGFGEASTSHAWTCEGQVRPPGRKLEEDVLEEARCCWIGNRLSETRVVDEEDSKRDAENRVATSSLLQALVTVLESETEAEAMQVDVPHQGDESIGIGQKEGLDGSKPNG